jgi:hypothetical protein
MMDRLRDEVQSRLDLDALRQVRELETQERARLVKLSSKASMKGK